MDNYKVFSERLKKLRADEGLTQTEFANKIGATKQTISTYENNPKSISFDIVMQIAKYYNVSLDWLFGNTTIPNSSDLSKITYGDVLIVLNNLCNISELNPIISTSHLLLKKDKDCDTKIYKDCSGICFDNSIVNDFIKEWHDIKNLYDTGTIKSDLYNLWISDKIESLQGSTVQESPIKPNTVTSDGLRPSSYHKS